MFAFALVILSLFICLHSFLQLIDSMSFTFCQLFGIYWIFTICLSHCIWLFKTTMTFLYIFAICHLFTIRSLVITLTIYSLRNIWLHISHLPFDTFTLPFVCHLIHSHCHLFAIHLKLTVKAYFTFLLIWHSLFLFTVKLGRPHTIERTRSDGIFLECRRRCRADAWTTRLGMNVRHWGETWIYLKIV